MHEIMIDTYEAVVDGDTLTEEKTDFETVTIDELGKPGQIGFYKSAFEDHRRKQNLAIEDYVWFSIPNHQRRVGSHRVQRPF